MCLAAARTARVWTPRLKAHRAMCRPPIAEPAMAPIPGPARIGRKARRRAVSGGGGKGVDRRGAFVTGCSRAENAFRGAESPFHACERGMWRSGGQRVNR